MTKKRILAAVFAAFAAFAIGLSWPMDTAPYLDTNASGEMLDRSGRLLYPFLNGEDQWCFPRRLGDISPYLIQATLAAEDERFYQHPGVDPLAVLRAVGQNLWNQHVVSGASTLTMQVVKLREGGRRSMGDKARQAWTALRLDARVDKDVLLETYLNRAPYGLNLVGCEAASRRYFGKPASELSVAEAALLAGLPKGPTSLMPLRHAERAEARRDYVLQRMSEAGYLTSAESERAQTAPLTTAWHTFPCLAPHWAASMRPVAGRVDTTLDAELQARTEERIGQWLKRFDGAITNAAAIVVDVADASVLVRVGSADFFGTPGGGQVDCCAAPRSPGSALKPFTYAAAMEHQLLYPTETLLDGLLDYGLYNPGNFDGKFKGLIDAGQALRRSLNVPAVTVLDRVGVDAVYALLKSSGLSTLRKSAGYYGLGLTLGNCEVRLDELAAAYCMIANLGEYRPLRTRRGAPDGETRRCLSRGTCLSLFEMLDQTPPGELARELVRARGAAPRVCWKTGTSTGHQDAWAMVFNRNYVVGVWMGNNSGRASGRLVGGEVALPLAARIFRSLPVKNAPEWPESAGELREVRVCATSGLPAVRWCGRTRTAWLPREMYLHRVCDMHYPGSDGGGCVERWPGSAKGWDLARIDAPRILDPAREVQTQIEALRILAPAGRGEYVVTGQGTPDRLQLRASRGETETLHWYLDDRYVGMTAPETPLFIDLAPGKHNVGCMASDGTIDHVEFAVVKPDAAMAIY